MSKPQPVDDMRGDSFLQFCDEATDISSMLLLLGILWAQCVWCVYMRYVVTGAWQRCSGSQTQLHLQHQKSPKRCSVFCLGQAQRPPSGLLPSKAPDGLGAVQGRAGSRLPWLLCKRPLMLQACSYPPPPPFCPCEIIIYRCSSRC